MIKFSTEKLREILAGAPDGATHWDLMATFKYKNLDKGVFYTDNGTPLAITEYYPSGGILRLSDLREILELRERVEELESQLERKANLSPPPTSDTVRGGGWRR